MSGTKKESHWIPLADLMTVLMVIFLFMSVSYMALKEKQKNKQDQKFKDYKELKATLYNELNEAFKNDTAKWNLKLDNDLSIKFTDPKVLFPSKEYIVPDKFKEILIVFIPKYLNVVLQEKYKDKIAEIRIEGHTDTIPINNKGDSYIDNMQLSQNRARNVLGFLRQQDCFIRLGSIKKDRLQYWLTANGLSYGRTVDKDFKNSYESQQPIDNNKSRRVEFRIVTASEKIINEELKSIEEK